MPVNKVMRIIDKALNDYISNPLMTYVDFSNKYGITKNHAKWLLKKNEIIIRKPPKIEAKRKYTINHNYFDNINTESKAYWLGWMYSDGYNNENRGELELCVQSQDKYILEKFSIAINSNRPISYKKNADAFRVGLNSRHMSQQLAKLGCVQRKSLILKFPTKEQVPFYLLRHFIRGYYDGNGSCSIYKNAYSRTCSAMIISTKDFCLSITDILKIELPFLKYYIRKNPSSAEGKPTTLLCFHQRTQVLPFLNWIYKDAYIYLPRKYKKYLDVIILAKNTNKSTRKNYDRKPI